MRRPPWRVPLVLLMLVGLGRLQALPGQSGASPDLQAVLAAEAARAATREHLDVLRRAARAGSTTVQRIAIRALGRLERPALVAEIALLLSRDDAGARAEAANAVAQAAGQDASAADTARLALTRRLSVESEADVRAAICEALGRLPLGSASDATAVERLLVDESSRVASRRGVRVAPASPLLGVRIGWGSSRRTSTPAAVGALRGLESLLRLRGRRSPPSAETLAQLRHVASAAVTPARRLSLLALNAVGGADEGTIDTALSDEDVEVRRLAAAAPGAVEEQLGRGLADRSPVVRYEALRAWGRRFQAARGCGPVVAAAGDANPHVALLAFDLLGNPCGAGEDAADVLKAAVSTFRSSSPSVSRATSSDQEGGSWHRPAHALAALARVSPEAARQTLPRFITGEPWQVRMYAARAAASLSDADALRRLATDSNPNVREAAVSGLAKTEKHAADAVYLRALEADDGQLVMTAARALDGTPSRDAAVEALLTALRRLTAAGRDTSRDPRLALLDRLRELGSREGVPALVPLLRDFDPRVAERAAAVLNAWTGEVHVAAPAARPVEEVPTADEISRLARTAVRVTMKDGSRFEIRLLADLSPLSCATFARLVSARYYDGLTFHRIVPNFIIQGGSPGANEFAGHSRFMRDEVGRKMQARGTVGTSTRGRDTGDAQFYVNLVDNPRLDHDYTIFGEVTSGMDAVDRILEGDIIERAEVVPARR